MNAALIALANHFEATKAGIVCDDVQAEQILFRLTGDYKAAHEAILALLDTGVFNGSCVPGVRTIARAARQAV